MSDLNPIITRLEKASPGPWHRQIGEHYREVWDYHGNIICRDTGANNGDFIANARLDVAELVVRVQKLSIKVMDLEKWQDEAATLKARIEEAKRIIDEHSEGEHGDIDDPCICWICQQLYPALMGE